MTVGRRGLQNACVWQTWQGYYLRVMSWSSLNINVFWSLQKTYVSKKSDLAWTYFKQNYCHACHTRFAVFFLLPSCCVSLGKFTTVASYMLSQFAHPAHHACCCVLMGVVAQSLKTVKLFAPCKQTQHCEFILTQFWTISFSVFSPPFFLQLGTFSLWY